MNHSELAQFTTQARLLVAANDAAREARIAALVARAPWSEWESEQARRMAA